RRVLAGVEPQQVAVAAAAPAQCPGSDQRPIGPLDTDRPHGGQLAPPPRIGTRPAGEGGTDPIRSTGRLAGEAVPIDQGTQRLDVVGPEGPGVQVRSSTTFPKVRSRSTSS